MDVYRAGRVALANAPGTGVADDKVDLRLRAGDDQVLPGRRADPAQRARPTSAGATTDRKHVLRTSGQAGREGRQRIGRLRHAGRPALDRRASARSSPAQIKANPRNYIAQPTLALSRVPTIVDDHFEGRHVDLRPYILYGKDIYVLPGGLTRVALRKGSLVVNSSQGGGSKDTWVLAPRSVDSQRRSAAMTDAHTKPLLSRVADSIYWMAATSSAPRTSRASSTSISTCMLDLPAAPPSSGSRSSTPPAIRAVFAKRYGEATQRQRDRSSSPSIPRIPTRSAPASAPRAKTRARCARSSRRRCGSRSTAFYLHASPPRAAPAHPTDLPDFCHQVRMGCHLFSGITDATMTTTRPGTSSASAASSSAPTRLAHPRREVLHPAALRRPTSARPTTTSSGRRC